MQQSRSWLVSMLLGTGSVLAACNGGGGDRPDQILSATPPDTSGAPSLGGIYNGTVTSSTRGGTFNVGGAAPENGQGNVQLAEPATGWQYTLALSSQVNGSVGGTVYAYNATGALVGQGAFSGSLTSRSRLTGSFSLGTGDQGSLSLAYDTRYTAPAALATVAGVYQWASPRSNAQLSRVTVSSGGGFSGQTETGCAFNGTASVLDVRYNLLSLSIDTGASGCEVVGQNAHLTGLAYYTPASGTTAAGLAAFATNSKGGIFAFYNKISN